MKKQLKENSIIKKMTASRPGEYWIGLLALLLFMGLLHFVIIDTNFGDDLYFKKILKNENYNIFTSATHRWLTTTARFGIELVMFVFQLLPQFIWKIVECIVICGLYHISTLYTKQYLPVALMLIAYPFMHMASAGWIATTTNYLWPFAAMILATHLLLKMQKKLTVGKCVIYFLLLTYFIFSEMMLVSYTCILIGMLISEKNNLKRSRIAIFVASAFIMLLGYANALFSPGNLSRGNLEISKWMPEYPDLSLPDRFRICAVSTLQHFTSIPNVIFFIFNCLLIIGVWSATKSKTRRIASVIPMIIDVISTLYYAYSEILIKHSLNYVLPKVTIVPGTEEFSLQIFLLAGAILYFLFSVYSVYIIFSNDSTAIAIRRCLILAVGMGTRFILMFSPTMLASGTRIYMVCYMAMMWIAIRILEKNNKKLIRIGLYIVLGIGVIINLVMVIMMQIKYGGPIF